MNNHYNDYADTLEQVRQELRLAPMLDLVSLAVEYGYDTTLDEIYYQPLPDLNDEVIRLEGTIIRCAVALAQRLGVGLNPQVAFNKPKEVVRIIHGLTDAFENFEDTDTLYGILLSGEPEQYIIENMIRYVYGDDDLHVEDLIVTVEPRTITVMRNFCAAMSAERSGESEFDARMARIVPYLRQYPQNPSSYVFMNLGPEIDVQALIKSLDFSDDNGVPELELLAIYAVGLSIINNDTYEDAYAALEGNLELINNENLPEGDVLKSCIAPLRAIYLLEAEAEQDNETN